MILEALAVGSLVHTFSSVNKSLNLDEKALKRYAKAFERNEEARLLIKNKEEYTDKRLMNVAKKKRAIMKNTVPQFVEVYGQIQKIDLGNNEKNNKIAIKEDANNLKIINSLTITTKKELTDKELICGHFFKGIGGIMVMDSERYSSAASNQMRQANVIYSQAESICTVYDSIINRADRIAKLLMAMNALFVRSIGETKKVIELNGDVVHNYSDYDKSTLMVCVNMAAAMADIINVPVVTSEGSVPEAAMATIVTGEKYLEKMSQAINL
ncbi:hypothetical protein [Lacrimispora sp.]|uniref:hypothetical protein n=1 Tax=Lacrimispora sp. TaxID=2719234 RepID=UPI00289999E7|nr:hypothetical protein [Lacrimispora sp.]